MFRNIIATLLVITPKQKISQCPFKEDQLNMAFYTHMLGYRTAVRNQDAVKYCAAVRMNGSQPQAATQMNVTYSMLSPGI